MSPNQKRTAILSRVKEANLEKKDKPSILLLGTAIFLVVPLVALFAIAFYAFISEGLYLKFDSYVLVFAIFLIPLAFLGPICYIFCGLTLISPLKIRISVRRFYETKEETLSHFETEESSINYLTEMLDSPNSLLRKKAIEKIVKFNGRAEQAILKLAEISGEKNSEMAKVAKEALEKISKTKRTNIIP